MALHPKHELHSSAANSTTRRQHPVRVFQSKPSHTSHTFLLMPGQSFNNTVRHHTRKTRSAPNLLFVALKQMSWLYESGWWTAFYKTAPLKTRKETELSVVGNWGSYWSLTGCKVEINCLFSLFVKFQTLVPGWGAKKCMPTRLRKIKDNFSQINC